jgi:hypothetical protein
MDCSIFVSTYNSVSTYKRPCIQGLGAVHSPGVTEHVTGVGVGQRLQVRGEGMALQDAGKV